MKKALAVILLSAAVLSLPAGCGKNLTPASPAPPSQVLSYSLDHFFGQSGSITMDGPIGVGISGNTLWVANFFGQNLEAWTLSGVGSLQFSSFNSGVTFDDPYGVTVGPDGFIYVTEELHYLVDEFSPDGAYVTNIPQPGTSTSDGVAVNGSNLYVSDFGDARVYRYSISGTEYSKTFSMAATFGTSGAGALLENVGMCLDASGKLYVADYGHGRVAEYDAGGNYLGQITAGLSVPRAVVVDPAGNLFVSDSGNSNIQVFNSAGSPVTQWSSSVHPDGLAMDSAGNLYVSDGLQSEVVVYKKN